MAKLSRLTTSPTALTGENSGCKQWNVYVFIVYTVFPYFLVYMDALHLQHMKFGLKFTLVCLVNRLAAWHVCRKSVGSKTSGSKLVIKDGIVTNLVLLLDYTREHISQY